MRHLMKSQSEVVTSSVLQNKGSDCRKQSADMDMCQSNFFIRKAKRYRSAFTTEQVNYLENEFRKFPYIANAHRKEVANVLNIPERAVKIWFQNRRMKEKKEAVIKEPELDDQNNHINVEFTNDPLNNVKYNAKSSANDRRSQSLLSSHEEVQNKNDDRTRTCYPEPITEPPKTMFYKEMSPKQDASTSFNGDLPASVPVLKNNVVPCYKSSAEFSINLCKKYRNDLIFKNQMTNETTLDNAPLPLIRQDKSEESKFLNQNVPEDLSYNKVKCKSELDSHPKTVSPSLSPSSVGFQPVYVANYAQPYLPATNLLWKPLNVMPVMPTGTSAVTISSNLTGNLSVSQEQAVPKKTCNCDCHSNVPTRMNITENSQSLPTQYIITAVPFQNIPKF